MVVPRASMVVGTEDLGEQIRIPAPAFLVEHRDGLVLFDAGFAPGAVTHPDEVYGERARRLQLELGPDQIVDRQVRNRGFDPSRVTYVALSHLHYDHVGGAHLFPSAQILTGAGELEHARSGNDRYCLPADLDRLLPLAPRELAVGDTDLFGDGSVVLLALPGHTPGQLGLQVRLRSRTVVVTGDAAHLQLGIEAEQPFPGDGDPVAAVASLRRLRSVRAQESATVWVSHDPDDWAAHSDAPDGLS